MMLRPNSLTVSLHRAVSVLDPGIEVVDVGNWVGVPVEALVGTGVPDEASVDIDSSKDSGKDSGTYSYSTGSCRYVA